MQMILKTFDFRTQPVRVLERERSPWFVAADVCRVLGFANPTDVLLSLDADEKDKLDRTTLGVSEGAKGGAKFLNVINESGLYALVFRSRKATARAFRKWVTSEVLPAIRQTGGFSIGGVECDPERLSILEFLSSKGDTRGWGLDGLIEFGRKVRLMRLNLGAEYQSKADASFGRVEVYPLMILETAFAALRPLAIGQPIQLGLFPVPHPFAAAA